MQMGFRKMLTRGPKQQDWPTFTPFKELKEAREELIQCYESMAYMKQKNFELRMKMNELEAENKALQETLDHYAQED